MQNRGIGIESSPSNMKVLQTPEQNQGEAKLDYI
jgi:hypothetical protein